MEEGESKLFVYISAELITKEQSLWFINDVETFFFFWKLKNFSLSRKLLTQLSLSFSHNKKFVWIVNECFGDYLEARAGE
jgi:hypothetical protein